ncbi:clumping factor A-like [Panicum virgatum]|uniref:clumping factor A-like n=1 Tax=Panicum virgatum TaxID=38727 RepID=UPI0019D68346|nr:clumping factor A-like [Panicum virgatum]
MALPIVQVLVLKDVQRIVSLNVPSRVDIVGAESVRAAAAMAALLKDKHNRGVEKDVLEEDSAADEEEGEKVDNKCVEGKREKDSDVADSDADAEHDSATDDEEYNPTIDNEEEGEKADNEREKDSDAADSDADADHDSATDDKEVGPTIDDEEEGEKADNVGEKDFDGSTSAPRGARAETKGGRGGREARQAEEDRHGRRRGLHAAQDKKQGKWVATRLNNLIEYVNYLHEVCPVKM